MRPSTNNDKDDHPDSNFLTTTASPLPLPHPSFGYGTRPSTDSIRSLVDHSYSSLFTNGLYNSSFKDQHHLPHPPSPPPRHPIENKPDHLPSTLPFNLPDLPDPTTFSTPGKKKSSSSLISSLSSRSPFSRRRTRKQSNVTVTNSTTTTTTMSATGSSECLVGSTGMPNDTPGKHSLNSSHSSSKVSPGRSRGTVGGPGSPFKSPKGKSSVEASLKRMGKGKGGRGLSEATGMPVTPRRHGPGPASAPGHSLGGAHESGTTITQGTIPTRDDEDVEMMDIPDPALDLQNDLSALESINEMLGLPTEKTVTMGGRTGQTQGPKKKRSLLGFAVRGGSKVPFVAGGDDEGSVGRKSGGWVRASMEHFTRDAPTPPPMMPLPPLPQMMNNLSLEAGSKPASHDAKDSASTTKRPNLKPFRLRSLLNLNMGTPKKQPSAAHMHASPASFVGGGRYSPGESPLDEQSPFSVFHPTATPRKSKEEVVRSEARMVFDLPPRPGTSLGTYTPKKKSSVSGLPGQKGFVGSSASTPVLSLPSGAHWSASNPTQGRIKMSMGPGGKLPPARPSSRPSLGSDRVLAGRPSLNEVRERALSPTPSSVVGGFIQPRSGMTGSQSYRTPLVTRSTSNSILTERSGGNTPVPRPGTHNADKRFGKVLGDKAESPLEGLPFKNGDGWSTPYPTAEPADIEIGRPDVGYPFPAVPAMPKIKSRSSSRSSIFDIHHTTDKSQRTSRSRFDSRAFEYQAFETDHRGAGRGTNGQGSRDSSPPPSGWKGYETTASSGFGSVKSSRPGSRMGGTISEDGAEDKENQGMSGVARKAGMNRTRPIPAVFSSGRESRTTMRG